MWCSSLPTLSKNGLIGLCTMLPDVKVNEITLDEGDGCTSDLACQTSQSGMVLFGSLLDQFVGIIDHANGL